MSKTTRNLMMAAAAIVVVWAAPALAFHDDGVAHCNGCHTMHNSQNGVAMNFDAAGTGPGTLPGQGYTDLLLFGNKADVCLRCHAGEDSYHVWSASFTAPSSSAERGGGDFVFLEDDNINDAHGGASNPVLGRSAGHSVVSAMKGTVADGTFTTAPGGDYPSVDMTCTSCHDPHGTDAYRLTYKTGQSTTSDTGYIVDWDATIVGDAMNFQFGPPGTSTAETGTNHNGYQAGMSEWCSECHGDFHDAPSSALIHPSGSALETRQIAVYNAYNGTTDCVNNGPTTTAPCGTGTFAGAYLHWVPLEDAGRLTSTVTGATPTSKVVCVSCHRAHATSAPDAGRWDFNVTGLAEDGHESTSYAIPNPFDGFQRSLCNKCHAQDEFDALVDFTP